MLVQAGLAQSRSEAAGKLIAMRQTAIDDAEEKGNDEIAKLMLEELEKRRGNHG
ncbi:hypothetical protein [Geobacillus sp. YF-1]|uniref:hypothetical protein n=1 Tax=Geobacillus sp. YF-1 TaxID=3457480 RepID=UPI0040456289